MTKAKTKHVGFSETLVRLLVCALVLMGAVIVGSGAVWAQLPEPQPDTCVDDVTGRINVCTANDIEISLVFNDEDVSCELGSVVEVSLTAMLQATANERWDIGISIARDGGNARTGMCFQDYLRPIGAEADPLSGVGPFYDGEAAVDPADLCGDLEQGVLTKYSFPVDYDDPPNQLVLELPCVDIGWRWSNGCW